MRHAGNDANDGSSWNAAFATLQKAANSLSSGGATNVVLVQASAEGQAYGPVSKTSWANPPPWHIRFLGGWENVDGEPVQTGLSSVANSGDPALAGFNFTMADQHGMKRHIVIEGFRIVNVTDGIRIVAAGASDSADCVLTVRNVSISARNSGIVLDYPKPHGIHTGVGGLARLTAENLDIRAGLGGSGDGVYVRGASLGSVVTASGNDPATGFPRVSGVVSEGGFGMRFLATAHQNVPYTAAFSNTVVYGSASNGLDVAGNSATQTRLTLFRCTVADNEGDGLRMTIGTTGSRAAVTNCIFAGNGGNGINLGEAGVSVFTCLEGYNVFFGDALLVEGSAQDPDDTSSAGDPLFYAGKTKPHPWYTLGSKSSPAYGSATPSGNRGAYQEVTPWPRTTMFRIF